MNEIQECFRKKLISRETKKENTTKIKKNTITKKGNNKTKIKIIVKYYVCIGVGDNRSRNK